MSKKAREYTGDGMREAIRRAMAIGLTDEKTVETLSARGMMKAGEKITVGEAIARLRVVTELDGPSPAGFEKLARELDGGDGAEGLSVIEISAPKEYLG